MDLTKALAPKSDQLDFADLEGQPPRVFTITDVGENGGELSDQQPVNIRLAEFPRVWRPSKGMLRVLADNWGRVPAEWVGRQVELYGDPEVWFGKEKVGGTRISRLSHIAKKNTTRINPRGGKGAYWTVEPLPAPSAQKPADDPLHALWQRMNAAIPKEQAKAFLEAAIGHTIDAATDVTPDEATEILAAFDTLAAEFKGAES